MARLTLLSVAHPWQCDSMGHMNVRHYAALFDDASFQLLGFIAGSTGQGWADVRCEIDYRSETPAGTLLTIESNLLRLGKSSLTYRHRMSDTSSGELKAEAVVTTVRFDLQARKSMPLSDDERARAETLMETGKA